MPHEILTNNKYRMRHLLGYILLRCRGLPICHTKDHNTTPKLITKTTCDL